MKYCHHLLIGLWRDHRNEYCQENAVHIGAGIWQHSTNLIDKSQIKYLTSDTQRADLRETEGKWVTEPT